MASNFLYSTRDQKFILKEWLDMSKVFEAGRFQRGYSVDDIDSILENAMKIAKEAVAQLTTMAIQFTLFIKTAKSPSRIL